MPGLVAEGRWFPVQGSVSQDVAPQDDCGCCGALLGPSSDWLWHEEDEDCRAIRQPVTGLSTGETVMCVLGPVVGFPEYVRVEVVNPFLDGGRTSVVSVRRELLVSA